MMTREKLVTSAMRLFADQGFWQTSVADILADACVNSGSLYHFFDSKEDLLTEVLRTYRDNIGPMLVQPAWRGVDNPIERVFALLAAYRRLLLKSELKYGCPIGYIALELHHPPPKVRALLVANFDVWTGIVEKCFVQAKDRFPPEFDPRRAAVFTLTVMEGAVMQARTYRDVKSFDDSIASLRIYLETMMELQEARAKKGGRK
jgi:AcrR family transcriptional regulator